MIGYFLSAFPFFALSLFFLITWISPLSFGEQAVKYALFLMLLEFIVVHSAGFMGFVVLSRTTKVQKIIRFLGLVLFYSLFAGAFSLAYGDWWPLIAFWCLSFNRIMVVFTGPLSEEAKSRMQMDWVLGVFLYVVLAIVTTLLPIPALGVSERVVAAQGFEMSGEWVEHPQRVLAFGFLYFGLFGAVELLLSRRAAKPASE